MPLLERNGVGLFVEARDGPGQPIVLLHGWCCDRSFLAPQADYFASLGHRVICPDLRGHGESAQPRDQPYTMEIFADDIAWICEAMKIEKPIVVGHSMGGIVAYEIARRHIHLPVAIVMLDATIVMPEAARAATPAFIERLRGPDRIEAVRDFVGRIFFLSSDDPQRKARILDIMASAPQHVMVSAYEGLRDFEPDGGSERVAAPALYVSADEPTQRTDMARTKALIPHLVTGQVVGSGHFCQLEVPDQVNAMIARFITLSAKSGRADRDWVPAERA